MNKYLMFRVTFQQLRLLNIKDGPRNLATSKTIFSGQD